MTEADTGSISVSLTDSKGKTVPVKLQGIPNKNCTLKNAEKLANFLKKYSVARVSGYGANKGVQDDAAGNGKYNRVLQKLKMIFKDFRANKTKTFSIPAPKDSFVDDDQEPHSDVPEDVRDLLKELGAIKEKDELEYKGGGIDSKLPKSGARKTKTTGV